MFGSLRNYRREFLRLDIIAGLTTAAVVIPKAMAYATIAGLPVEVGLYTAFAPMLLYALFGSSRALSVSTTTTLAILLGAELSQLPSSDPANLLRHAVTLTAMTGIVLILAGLLRLGFVANFISEPVLIGFKAGIGIVIIFDQIPKLLGVHIDKSGFFRNIASVIRHLDETSLATVVVGVSIIALLLAIEYLWPKAPAPLIAVALSIAATRLLDLPGRGVEIVGKVLTGLPSVTLPDFSLAEAMWPAAMGIALMSFTETVAAGRAFARADEPLPRANRELLATGAANIGGALLGAMPAGGGTSQTAVNVLAGARTQLSEIVTAAGTLVTMLLLAPLIGDMPQATLAAVVVVYSLGLIKPVEFKSILRIRRREFVWALAALLGVVLLGTLKGIVVAIVLSLIWLSQHVADPPVTVIARKRGTNVFRPLSPDHPDDETFPGLLMLRLSGMIFFLNAERLAQKIHPLIEQSGARVVAIDFSGVPDLEYTALKAMIEGERRWREHGVMVWLVGLNPTVLEVIRRSSLHETLGRDRMLFNLETAVERLQSQPMA